MTEQELQEFDQAAEVFFTKLRHVLVGLARQSVATNGRGLGDRSLWLNVSELADYLERSETQIRKWRLAGYFPEPDGIRGNQKLWRKTTVDEWVDDPKRPSFEEFNKT